MGCGQSSFDTGLYRNKIYKNDNYREILMFNGEFKRGRPVGKGQLYREKMVIKNTPTTNNTDSVRNLIYCKEERPRILGLDSVPTGERKTPLTLIELIRSTEKNYNECSQNDNLT
jgi:hypothetical protein